MLGRYTHSVLVFLIVLLAAANLLAAPSQIQELSISHEGNFTVLTITGDGTARIAHQSVAAKDGKPFRIVIDCLAARHALPQKVYSDLPKSAVTAIRTSQYAVQPEEVVRVVLDLAEESVYRVETAGSAIKVYISDSKTSDFPVWSSTENDQQPVQKSEQLRAEKPVPSIVKQAIVDQPQKREVVEEPTVTVVAQKPVNDEDNEDVDHAASFLPKPIQARQERSADDNNELALKEQPVQKTQSGKSVEKPQAPVNKLPAPKQAFAYGPRTPQTPAKSVEPVKKQTQTTLAQAEKVVEPKENKTPAMRKQVEKKAEPVQEKAQMVQAPAKPQVKPQPVPQRDPSIIIASDKPLEGIVYGPSTQTLLAARVQAQPKQYASVEPGNDKQAIPGRTPGMKTEDVHKEAPAKKEKDTMLASAAHASDARPVDNVTPGTVSADIPESEEAPKKPSKYRQSAAKRAGLKQTQVVQFPQRMVTKYKSGNQRDPFRTLVDESHPSKGSINNRKVPNVETLYLVGILQADNGKSSALLEDLDGIGYILKPGDRVKNGYVAQIDNQNIYFQINEYGWSRTIVKHMDKEK